MDIDEYTSRLNKIEAKIVKIIPEKADSSWLEEVSGSPENSIPFSTFEQILNPAKALLSRGGKRWRPVLMVCLCELLGGGEKAYPLTPIIELVHNGSLIVDDIEDSSEFRRGGKAIHLIYGIDNAINCGNFLYFLPTLLIERSGLPLAKQTLLFSIFLENMRRLHLGQGLDILWHKDPVFCPSREEYIQMCSYKTGALSRMAAQFGAACAVDDPEVRATFGRFAENLGVAFQILDDVTNLKTGNPGKIRGDDIVEGKKSLPIIFFMNSGSREKTEFLNLLEKAKGLGVSAGFRVIEDAISLLDKTGSINKAESLAAELLREAGEMLKAETEPSVPREIIVSLIDGFLETTG